MRLHALCAHVLCFVSCFTIGMSGGDLPYPRSEIPTGGAGPIFVVSTANIARKEDVITLQTLAGVLARHSPRIYTVNSDPDAPADGDTTVFWLKQIQATSGLIFKKDFLDDLLGVLRHFRTNITGYVWFDMAAGSTNTALIHCAAAAGNVIAVGTNETASALEAFGVPRMADVSKASPLEELRASRTSLNARAAAFQPDDGRNGQCLSDYAVFGRFPTVEHAQGSTAFDEALAGLDSESVNAAFGWGYDEHLLVARSNGAGAVVHASDFSANLAFLSNFPSVSPPAQATKVAPPTPAAVHTVAFMMSDGDNLQLLEGDWISDKYYGSPERGSVPLGWSYSPAVSVLMPPVMEWVRSTMTVNDSLQAAPSGLGYAYPQLLPEKQAESFAKLTAQLMEISGMRLLNVLGVTPSAESLANLVAQPAVDGVVYFSFSTERSGYSALHGNVAYLNGKPVVGARMNLWGDDTSGDKVGVEALVRELSSLPRDPSDPNSYSIVVVNMGSHPYSDVVRAVRLLEASGGFEVLLPEALVERLVRETRGQQQCPMPSGLWSSQCGDLPKCWFSGNGTCVMTCENLDGLGIPIPVACDLDACDNLTLAPLRTHFLCEDGRRCPARSAGQFVV